MPLLIDTYGAPLLNFASDEELPTSCDVAIVGGGILGASTALELATRGINVALFEKGAIGAEQSSRNWGWIRIAGRDLREIPLMQQAQKIWQSLQARIGPDLGFRQAGIVYVEMDEAAHERHQKWIGLASEMGVTAHSISAGQVREFVPAINRPIAGGLWLPEDAAAEPATAAPLIATEARKVGAKVYQKCAVRGLDISAGRVSGIVTERGRVKANTVIVAGGAWTSYLLWLHGIRLPQLNVVSSVMRLAALETGIGPEMSFRDFSFRKRSDGGYSLASGATSIAEIVPDSFRFFGDFISGFLHHTDGMKLRVRGSLIEQTRRMFIHGPDKISAFERQRVLNPMPDLMALKGVESRIKQTLPAFATAARVQHWAGYIDAVPDAIPVLSDVASLPGLIVGTGLSGHGFGIAPGAGQLLAELATNSTPCVDPTPFRISRFAEGKGRTIQTWL